MASALVGLLVVVALGARGAHPRPGHIGVHQREVPAQVANDLLTVVIIVYGLALVGLIAAVVAMRAEWVPVRRRWWRDIAIVVIAMVWLALVGLRVADEPAFLHFGHRAQQQQPQVVPQSGLGRTAPVRTLPKRPAPSEPAHFDWQLAAALAGLGLAGTVFYFVRTRRKETAPVDEAADEELSAAVSDAIDDLRGEQDARRAVIAAYARMEGALGRHGHARRPAEAPFEYLARILLAHRVRPRAVRELTELFERAKFSTHAIDAPMKERAISALLAVRDDLQAAAA